MDLQELLNQKAELTAALRWIPYDGSIEVKTVSDGKYLYLRRCVAGKMTSTYIDRYSDELHALLLRQTKTARELKKAIRGIEKKLAELGYKEAELSPAVLLNLDFARANVKHLIYDQAVLEGVSTTFPQTETILENGKVFGVTATDVQKILNLKHAWEFILDKDVLSAPSDYHLLCHIAKLVNEGFYEYGGKIRCVPVSIGGTSFIPPIPEEADVKDRLQEILAQKTDAVEVAMDLCLYAMKTQIFNDGNKRAAIIYANHYLIGKGGGLLVIPEQDVPAFKYKLIDYYEGKDETEIRRFLREVCFRTI